MFSYNDLRRFCEKAHVSVQEIAEECNLTDTGIKKGLTKESLSLRYVLPICKAVGITPNQFFGVDGDHRISQVQNGGVGNTQSLSDSEALRDQLKVKDEQINKLLNLLSK